MKDPDYDAIVVGSGAGGGACAWALARHGIQVLVIEAGGRYRPEQDYLLHHPDWEKQSFPTGGAQFVHKSARLQSLEEGNRDLFSWNRTSGRINPSSRRQYSAYHHVRGVGGTTLHFAGEAHRLHPDAMAMYTRFGVGADWPITYAQLEPYYLLAERVVGVAGDSNESGLRWRSAPYPLPAHPLSYASQKIATACKRLGFHWQANSKAILSRPYDDRPPCNYCGNCTRGCPRDDKGSVDVTYLRHAEESGYCTVVPDSQVVLVEGGERDRVRGVHYRDVGGVSRLAEGRVVILACGAVQTPRLLLASAGKVAPEGMANEEGQVGRHFLETLAWVSTGLHPELLASFRGIPSDGICWDFNHPDAIDGVVGGMRFSSGVQEAGLNGPIAYAQRLVGGWGHAHKKAMHERFGRALTVGAIGEFLPNTKTFIDLDPRSSDEHGVPNVRINSHLSQMDVDRLRFMATICRQVLDASGVERLEEEYGTYDQFSSTHVFGSCRMGVDPQRSVVDGDCKAHRWENLYIADASVMPSSGGGESPSLSIQALALRLADHLRDRLVRREL